MPAGGAGLLQSTELQCLRPCAKAPQCPPHLSKARARGVAVGRHHAVVVPRRAALRCRGGAARMFPIDAPAAAASRGRLPAALLHLLWPLSPPVLLPSLHPSPGSPFVVSALPAQPCPPLPYPTLPCPALPRPAPPCPSAHRHGHLGGLAHDAQDLVQLVALVLAWGGWLVGGAAAWAQRRATNP